MPQIANGKNGSATGRSERPHRYTVFLIYDGTVPQEFVSTVLRSVFPLSEGQALRVVTAASLSGTGVVGVYTQEIAEMKAIQAIRLGGAYGYTMSFATRREE